MNRAHWACAIAWLAACAGPARPPAEPPPTHRQPAEAQPLVDAGAAAEQPSDPDPVQSPSLHALRGRLRNTLELGQHGLLALPSSWPPSDRTLVFFIYTTEPLPTGRVTERIEGPVAVARVDALDLSVDLEDIVTMPMVVEREPPRPTGEDVRRRAEALLLDVVAGRTRPDDAHDGLQADYCKLLDDGALGDDLRKRTPEFVTWLQCGGFNDRGRVQIQTAQ